MGQITRESYDKLIASYKSLEVEQKAASKRIGEAAAMGDLSENSEFDAAREELRNIGLRMKQISEKISTSMVIEKVILDGKVNLGNTVKIQEDEEVYDISVVNVEELDSSLSKVTIDSPFGSVLMGKSVGDVVSVKSPSGSFDVKILEIK